MPGLSDDQVDRLAERLVNKVREGKHEFWIDPEQHYQDHAKIGHLQSDEIHTLKDLIAAYRNARTLFWRAFLGLAILGSVVMAALGMGLKIGD